MRIFTLLDRILIVIAVGALVVMTLLITVSVIGRYLFSAPIPDDLVMSEFLIVFVVFLPLSAVQAAREHVFVTIFTEWMSTKTKVVMETVGVFIGLGTFTVVSMAVFTDFQHAWEVGAFHEGVLELPEAPPRFIVFFGLAIFTLRLLLDAVQSVIGLVNGTAVAAKAETARALETEI